jgi:hypothetical protein
MFCKRSGTTHTHMFACINQHMCMCYITILMLYIFLNIVLMFLPLCLDIIVYLYVTLPQFTMYECLYYTLIYMHIFNSTKVCYTGTCCKQPYGPNGTNAFKLSNDFVGIIKILLFSLIIIIYMYVTLFQLNRAMYDCPCYNHCLQIFNSTKVRYTGTCYKQTDGPNGANALSNVYVGIVKIFLFLLNVLLLNVLNMCVYWLHSDMFTINMYIVNNLISWILLIT